jgi:hypothetical protein
MRVLLFLVPIALDVALIVHIVRTGRERFWIYIIVFLPMAGPLAYLVVEVLPDLLRGRGAHVVRAGVSRALDPTRNIRELQAALDMSPTVQNRSALAAAWEQAGDPAKAAELYAACLEGIYRNDRQLMSRLAQAHQAAGHAAQAREVFDAMIRQHGPLAGGRELLCHALSLEALEERQAADEVFRAAVARSSDLEPRYRYAAFLKKTGRRAEADEQVRSIVTGFEFLPRYVRKSQKQWVEAARGL